MNWALADTGSFDYAADAWGYTYGAAAEWYQGQWTLRGGGFDLSTVPNSTALDPSFGQFQLVGEIERRFERLERAGQGRGHAVAQPRPHGHLHGCGPVGRDDRAARGHHGRPSLQEPLGTGREPRAAADTRLGPVSSNRIRQPQRRALRVHRHRSNGGARRPAHRPAMATSRRHHRFRRDPQRHLGAPRGVSERGRSRDPDRRRKLPHPGLEQILETYYSVALRAWRITFDYQFFNNPAYNRDRGPVSVLGIRLHGQF